MAKVQIFIISRRLGETMTFRLFIASALLLGQIGVTPSGAQPASQSNETVSLSVGASQTIVLSENPSTGYEWQLNTAQSSNLAIVLMIDVGYEAGQSGLIGAPGSHRWQIEAQAPGTARIVFTYSRPWEQGPPAETHVVEVNVTRGQ
ncbi:MAG: protease inhibitor I42 family protein [Xanthobacteraceae bacterium]|jgi:inhibitor of cysteine peptidase